MTAVPAPAPGLDPDPSGSPHLHRRFGLLQATALNMSNMIGMGPFMTIPLLMSAMNGPQALLGWFVALLITIPDGLVWAELGAALPGSGGSYVYLREGFGREKWGRFMAFLFIWQFILSGPLEIASGYIGAANYLGYVWPGLTWTQNKLVCVGIGLVAIALLYRRIQSIAWITVALWIGTLVTVGVVILSGLTHFSPARAFDFPPDAFRFTTGFFLGLGAASAVGIYDYLGYYDVCYIGDEVRNPGRTIPRSVIFSLLAVALIYLLINLSIIGVLHWSQFVPAEAHPESAFIVSIFMEKLWGSTTASIFTALVCWTAFGSVFALLLGYSRIPFAAAMDGGFFRWFGRLHPTRHFPHRSLLLIGLVAIACSFFSLDVVIGALLTTRIVVQFMGQVGALILLRRHRPDLARPFKMWLYPLPCLVALLGWVFLLATTNPRILLYGVATLALGVVAFLVWAARQRVWPFQAR